MSYIDPTGAGNSDYSYIFSPSVAGGVPTPVPPTGLPGDVQSSNRGEQKSLYSSGGWEADLLSIVNGQGRLAGNDVPPVDLSPFLALIKESSGDTADDADVESDFEGFLLSERKRAQSSGGDLPASTLNADLQSFLGAEEQKYQPPGQD